MDSSTRPNTFLPLSLFLSISALLFFLAKDRIPNSFLSFFPYALLFFLAIDRTPTSRNSMVQLAIAVFFFFEEERERARSSRWHVAFPNLWSPMLSPTTQAISHQLWPFNLISFAPAVSNYSGSTPLASSSASAGTWLGFHFLIFVSCWDRQSSADFKPQF